MTRYRILVVLLVLAAVVTGYSLSQPNTAIGSAAFVAAVATAVLGSFVAKPELYNSGAPFFRPGGAVRARARAGRSVLLGLGLIILGGALAGIFYAATKRPALADGFHLSIGYLIVAGMALFCGGIAAWCVARFLKETPAA